MNAMIKGTEITYNNGQKFIVRLTDESYANVFGCLLDDISVSVSHTRVEEQMRDECDECDECAD